MVVVGDDYFIARLQIDTGNDNVAAFARITCDSDLVGRNAQHRGQLGSKTLAHWHVLVAILKGWISMEISKEFEMPVHHWS